MIHNIAIIGAGQLGSRHLQALAASQHQLSIYVLDVSDANLAIANTRWEEVSHNSNHAVQFTTTINDLPQAIDVAIIATSSSVRLQVIEMLLGHSKVKAFILEKFLFQSPKAFSTATALFKQHNVKAWVNCPRRMFSYYKDLKNKIGNHTPIHVQVTARNLGVGCNTVHFLDLFAFLTNNPSLSVDLSGLAKKVLNSKREGYVEFTGLVTAKDAVGNSFTLFSFEHGQSPTIVQISNDKSTYQIIEKAQSIISEPLLPEVEAIQHNMPFQSQLTHLTVDQLLNKNECELTPFHEATLIHLAFLKPLIAFHNQLTQQELDYCSIT